VSRLTANAVTIGAALVAVAVTAQAAPPGGFTPILAPRSPQIMLYISHSIGGGAGSAATGFTRPTFGLRVEQVRQGSNMGDPDGGDAFSHRELINWQMQAHSNFHLSDMRVQLGHRLTYDVTNHQFGSPGARSAMPIGTLSVRNGSVTAVESRPAFGHAGNDVMTSRDAFRDTSSLRELASAAVAALAPSRFTSVQRQVNPRQAVFGQRPQVTHNPNN
jgi:hypothetical protein